MFLKNNLIKLPKTLALQLTLLYTAVFVVFIIISFATFKYTINSILSSQLDADLYEDIDEYTVLLKKEGLQQVKLELKRESLTEDTDKFFLRFFTSKGDILFSSDMSNWKELTPHQIEANSISVPSPTMIDTRQFANHKYGTRTITSLVGPELILQIGESLEEKDQLIQLIVKIFIVLFLGLLPVATFASWLMARKAMQGVNEVSRTAIAIANGSLDSRVDTKYKGQEIEHLIGSFNSMAEHNQFLVNSIREISDNIAHDIRSPLARIHAIAESSLSNNANDKNCTIALADTLEESNRLLAMINTMLDVTDVEAGINKMKIENINLSVIVKELVELFTPLAESRKITLALEIEPNCDIQGNLQHLQRMIANLIDNALKYTLSTGTITVTLSTDKDDVVLCIRDTGIGISESDLTRIFQRFYRCDKSRTKEGCGLGLNLARAVARAHGGDILLTSVLGSGSEFTVLLPN